MYGFEYADDAALIDGNTTLASARVTALAEGSLKDTAMVISIRKSKAMHVHRTRILRTRIHQTARFEDPHGAMVRWRSNSAIPSWFSNRYSGQDSQTAGGGGDSGQGEHLRQCP